MDIWKRLWRKPLTTALWLIFAAVMTGFLTSAAALWLSSRQLARTLDESHTAIAVRSDPGIVIHRRLDGGVTWSVDERVFTAEDAAALEAMEGVKDVRSHVLTGGTSDGFSPIVDIRRELSWRANGEIGPYYNAAFAGELVKTRTEADSFYSSVLLLNPEFDEPLKNLRRSGGFIYKIDLGEDPDAARYFTEGDRYVVSGTFEPMVQEHWNIHLDGQESRFAPSYFVLDGGALTVQEGYLESLSARNMVWSVEKGGYVYETVTGSVFPAAERWEGDPSRFFDETPHDAWRVYRDAWERQNHALPVIGTDRLEAMFAFLHGDAIIIDGRAFTPEEYETGAKVLILSETMAARSGLQVGDTLTLSQYLLPDEQRIATEVGESKNNPVISYLNMDVKYGPEEAFTLVGIYRQQAAWSKDTYAFTPNTVFTPRKTQIHGGYGTIDAGFSKDIYGIYISLELVNGSVEEFLLALEQSPYAGQFYAFDQGFEAVQKDINGLSETTGRLLWIAAGGWMLLLLLYLLIYQSAQRRNLGVMRSLGVPPGRAAAYLWGSGMAVALCGIALGVLVCRVALAAVQEHVLADMLGAIDRTAYGGALVISEEVLKSMVAESGPGTEAQVLMALGEAGVMGLLTLIHACILCQREPRRLMEG